MRRTVGHALRTAVACVLCCACRAGQAAGQARDNTFAIGLARSVGRSSAAHTAEGDVLAPLRFTTLELELARPSRTDGKSGLEYVARAVPLAIMQGNPTQPAVMAQGAWRLSPATARGSAYGVGVKPAGLRGWMHLTDDVRIEADAAAGVMWFGTPLLAANASRFNFAYEFGLGLRAMHAMGRGFTVGYRRHHVSNAGIGEVNPGLNSHIVFIGYWLD